MCSIYKTELLIYFLMFLSPYYHLVIITFTSASLRHELVDEGSVVIRDVQQNDAGQYTCEAWNLAGSKTTSPVRLNVHSESWVTGVVE